jgi:hypothetical protein
MVLKDDWPASQASFNPTTLTAINADVIDAKWVSECLPVPNGESRYLSYYCNKCWALRNENKFSNGNIMNNKIILFSEPYSICFPYFYDLAITGQNAGASGVVATLRENDLPVYLAPHLVPFTSTLPFLAIQNVVGGYIGSSINKKIRVQALIHDIKNGVGPSYFPPAQYHASLPETDITMKCTLPSTTVASFKYVAGQATFNPANYPSIRMKIVRGKVDSSCKKVKDKQEGEDCGRCLNFLNARSGAIVSTAEGSGESINGKAIFLWDYELFCTNSMLDISLNAASAGAHGVIVGNR